MKSLFLMFLVVCSVFAIDFEGYTVTNFTNEECLAIGGVKTAAFDSTGCLWITGNYRTSYDTANKIPTKSLSVYDGSSWELVENDDFGEIIYSVNRVASGDLVVVSGLDQKVSPGTCQRKACPYKLEICKKTEQGFEKIDIRGKTLESSNSSFDINSSGDFWFIEKLSFSSRKLIRQTIGADDSTVFSFQDIFKKEPGEFERILQVIVDNNDIIWVTNGSDISRFIDGAWIISDHKMDWGRGIIRLSDGRVCFDGLETGADVYISYGDTVELHYQRSNLGWVFNDMMAFELSGSMWTYQFNRLNIVYPDSQYVQFTEQAGLISDTVNCVAISPNDSLVAIGTDKGLTLLKKKACYPCQTFVLRSNTNLPKRAVKASSFFYTLQGRRIPSSEISRGVYCRKAFGKTKTFIGFLKTGH